MHLSGYSFIGTDTSLPSLRLKIISGKYAFERDKTKKKKIAEKLTFKIGTHYVRHKEKLKRPADNETS